MAVPRAYKKQAFLDSIHKNCYELKPYLLDDGKEHPFAVICPGGSYSMVASFVEGLPFAERLNEMGYHAFVVYYHVKNKARFPAPQDDLARAVREILDHAGQWMLDTKGYSVWGASAGGHLAASFGTESMGYMKYGLPKPGAMVLTYPVITMAELTHADTRSNLLGDTPSPEQIAQTSVEQQVTESYPPAFIWCGDADTAVDPQNSRMMADALKANGVPCKLEVYPGVGHGVGIGDGLCCEDWIKHAVAFWETQRAERK